MDSTTALKINRRQLRARRFASQIINALDDWLPRGGTARNQIFEELYRNAYAANAEIINVPPECDEMDKVELERARVKAHPAFVRLNGNL